MLAKDNVSHGTHRVQMELPKSSFERLKAIKRKTEASTYAEVMKNALRLYEELIDQSEKGNQFMLKNKEGDQILYRIF